MKAITIEDTLVFNNKNDLIKVFLYMKLTAKGIQLSNNDLNMFVLFVSNEDKEQVIKDSLTKRFVKSEQSGENAVTRLVNHGLLLKVAKKTRKVNPEYFKEDADLIACKLVLYNDK